MELSPQSVARTTFKTVKKGYDPDEVRAYLAQLATAIESTQAQATAMEARARAAVARLQELAANPASGSSHGSSPRTAVDEAETISRTLLLAQRTADTTVAEAEANAKRIRDEADAEAREALDNAHELQNRLVEEAKSEARRAAEGARIEAESEVQSLLARRDFLLSDVDHLEQHVITHRDRLREVAGALTDIVERGPAGLADLRRPLMSAVSDPDVSSAHEPDTSDDTQAMSRTDLVDKNPDASAEEAREAEATDEGTGDDIGDDDTGPTTITPPAPGTDRPGDVTPPAGTTGGLFDEVTSEVPAVSRPAKDAFRGRGSDRR